MSTATNKKQSEILVSWMAKYPDIAKGCTSRSKEERNKIWKKLEIELNIVGPPVKSAFEWRKVWCDKKKYIRKKLSENPKSRTVTGRASYREYHFSSMEETIIKICAMNEMVKGSSSASNVRSPSCSKKQRIGDGCTVEQNKTQTDDFLENTFFKDHSALSCLTNLLEENKRHNQEMERLRKMEIEQEMSFMQKRLEIEEAKLQKMETKRHNQEMEILRKMEIDQEISYRQKLIEIEVAKLENMGIHLPKSEILD